MKLFFSRAAALVASVLVAGCAGFSEGGSSARFVTGGTQMVNGARVQTFARLDGPTVREVGVEVPFSVIQNPTEGGTGPAGSFINLPYPDIVRQTTLFNHFEMHWEPHGHPPAIFEVAHFDIHSYAVPEGDVRAIVPPDTVAPTADRLPPNFVYPGVEAAVPQMGVHAVNPNDLTPPFTEVMIHGFWGGQMIFIEPMVTQERLLSKANFTMPIGVPQTFGRSTRYPTRFRAEYLASKNVYRFVFDQFVEVD